MTMAEAKRSLSAYTRLSQMDTTRAVAAGDEFSYPSL